MTIQCRAINIYPGAHNLIISSYEWGINNVIQNNNTDTLIVGAPVLLPGSSVIVSLRVKNSCGNWSSIYSQTINIKGEKMEKTVNVVIDQPVVPVGIVLDYIGTADVTVTDQLNRPIEGASLDLDGTPTGLSTDANGKMSIPNIIYGTHTVKAIKI